METILGLIICEQLYFNIFCYFIVHYKFREHGFRFSGSAEWNGLHYITNSKLLKKQLKTVLLVLVLCSVLVRRS